MINEEKFKLKKNGELYRQGYCKHPELIENYDLAINDKENVWHCHHRLETHFSDGTPRPINAQLSQKELIALDMYYDRPPEELIFLSEKEHLIFKSGEANPFYGKTHTQEVKNKVIESNHRRKGEKRPNFHPSENSIAVFKKMKGSHWYTNGFENVRAFECPPGWKPGRTIH